MTVDLSSYKVSPNELSSSTKFDNLVQAVQDALNALPVAQLVAGTNSDFLQTISGVPTWVSAFSTYSPAWTSSGTAPAIGNGTLTGRYLQIGKLITASITWTPGSTTTFGTGNYFFSLPVARNDLAYSGVGIGIHAGSLYTFSPVDNSSTTIALLTPAIPAGIVGQLVPVTWANGDVIRLRLSYEAV